MKTLLKIFTGIVIGTSLLAFTPLGGESFSLHINGKEVIEHYFTAKATTPTVALNPDMANDQVSVYYNECGKIGTNRKLMLKDAQSRVLKEWRYDNAINEHTPMTFRVNEIVAYKTSAPLSLVYSSKEVSKQRLLTILTFDGSKTASK